MKKTLILTVTISIIAWCNLTPHTTQEPLKADTSFKKTTIDI